MTTESIPHAPFKFTQARLDALPPATGTRYTVRDSDQPGLICVIHPSGLRFPEGRRTLQVYARAKGIATPLRVSICEVGALPLTALKGQPSVRTQAAEILAKLRQGINPNEELRQQQAELRRQAQADAVATITLSEAFQKCNEIQPVSANTLSGYRVAIDRDLKDWKDKPLKDITATMAVMRHAELGKAPTGNPARAMQTLRKVHRFATQFWGTDDNELPFGRCPVDKVNVVARQWAKTAPRTRKLMDADLGPWLETALLDRAADIAVHSMKDMPMTLAPEFALVAIAEREVPQDAFVSNKYDSLDDMPPGAVVGTSSLRRESQIHAQYPMLAVSSLRGNLDTRLRKLDEGQYDAIILAAAGLTRLGLASRIRSTLPTEVSLPAAGQGALGIEALADRPEVAAWIAPLADARSAACVRAERATSRALAGSCEVPLGAYAEVQDGELWLRGFVALPDGTRIARAERRGPIDQPEALGLALAADLRADGADDILAAL